MTTKILFVDDDEELLQLFRTVLPPKYHYLMMPSPDGDPRGKVTMQKMSNYEVVTCNNGEDAIKIIQEHIEIENPISIAFIDYHFPRGMDGVEIADRIRKLDDKVEIVYATSTQKKELLENSSDKIRGNVVYFHKPFNVNELTGLISRLLQEHFMNMAS